MCSVLGEVKKHCKCCDEYKSLHEFYAKKDPSKADSYGLRHPCKKCEKENNILKSRTKDGLISKMIRHQRQHSKKRNHPMPKYTLVELRAWVFSQPNFNKLYEQWVESGYDRLLTPSCDREDNSQGYLFDNIRLVTFRENCNSAYNDRMIGKDGIAKKVNQYNLNGDLVAQYISTSKAAKENGLYQPNISLACSPDNRGMRVGNFLWEYRV